MGLDSFNKLLQFYRRQREVRPAIYAVEKQAFTPDEVFSLNQLQAQLNNPLLGPNWLQVVERGQAVDLAPATFNKTVQGKALRFLDKNFVNTYLARGAALVLEGLDILDPRINELVGEIDRAMPCAFSNCAAFFSQKGSEAYHGHVDTDDVLVMQIAGKKIWHIYEPQQRRYLGTSPLSEAELGPKMLELCLEPGDAFFLRAGVPHRCVTQDEVSLHLSFDLIDKTPGAADIAEVARHFYMRSSAEPHADVKQVSERFAAILQSKEVASELENATRATRASAERFRQAIAGASSVDFFERFSREK